MTNADIPEMLLKALRAGADVLQLVDLPHSGLRRHFLPVSVDLADGPHTSNAGGFIELLPDADHPLVRGMVLDHMTPYSVSYRVLEISVTDRARADMAHFLIARSVDEERAALGARRTTAAEGGAGRSAADRAAAAVLYSHHQVARLWLASGHHQLPWDDGSKRKPGAGLPVLHLAITRQLTATHLATPAGERLVARLPVWLATGGFECASDGEGGLLLPDHHYVAMVADLDSPIPPMLISNGNGMSTRLLAITG